jgi:hypothetical protein
MNNKTVSIEISLQEWWKGRLAIVNFKFISIAVEPV